MNNRPSDALQEPVDCCSECPAAVAPAAPVTLPCVRLRAISLPSGVRVYAESLRKNTLPDVLESDSVLLVCHVPTSIGSRCPAHRRRDLAHQNVELLSDRRIGRPGKPERRFAE